MTIWVDADACPVSVKEILCRAAERSGITTIFVANQGLPLPRLPVLKMLTVEKGFDKADDEIVRRVEPGDLVVSSDIPLASEVIEKGACVLSFRGESLTADNIRARLNMRDFLDTLRSSGVDTGGQASFRASDKKAFADRLDKWIQQTQKT
ncbi:MAG: YaiI/YqxD family protein [Pseudomonadales bacterium]|nr:YaiI/YqxD family protein [Pseudomonadales bacterium]